jgi:hypothetical protein
MSQQALWRDKLKLAEQKCNEAARLFRIDKAMNNRISLRRLQGMIDLARHDLPRAERRFRWAFDKARAGNRVEEELQVLAGQAEVYRQKKDYASARTCLQKIWGPANQAPYRMYHADGLNVLSELELDQGNRDAARIAALEAEQLATEDGEGFAYYWGLQKARKLLKRCDD